MENVDFGDFNKFLVSVGIAMVAGACGLLWLFLHDPFDLLVSADSLDKLTPIARSLIEYRQRLLSHLVPVVPLIAAPVAAGGAYVCYRGLKRWYPFQKLIEKEQSLRVQKLATELHQMARAEVIDKAKEEVARESLPQPVAPPTGLPVGAKAFTAAVRRYLEVEGEVTSALTRCMSQDYEVLANRRLGKLEFDAVLQSRRPEAADIIVEIMSLAAYDSRRACLAVTNAISKTKQFSASLVRPARALIVIVLPPDGLAAVATPGAQDRLVGELVANDPKALVRFVSSLQVARLTCSDVAALLDPTEPIGFIPSATEA